MRDFKAYVRSRLAPSGLSTNEEIKIVDELAGQLEELHQSLVDSGRPEDEAWARVQRAIRAVSEAAAELLRDPLRLREAEDGWASWRASWRAAQPASGASE